MVCGNCGKGAIMNEPAVVMGITYDTGARVAAERRERRIWARHRAIAAAVHRHIEVERP